MSETRGGLMPLRPVSFTKMLFQCSFCTTVHTTVKEAEQHGCTNGEPAQKFRVGQRVMAPFLTTVFGQPISEEMLHGEIIDVSRPSREPFVPALYRVLPPNCLIMNSPWWPHEWIYTVHLTENVAEKPWKVNSRQMFGESRLQAGKNE